MAAVLILVLTAGAAHRDRALTLARQETKDWEAVTDLAVSVHTDLEQARDQTSAAAGAPRAAGPTLAGVTLDRVDADLRASELKTLSGGDLRRPRVVALLGQAADTGEVVASPPVDLDSGTRLLMIAPHYHVGSAPRDLLARREALEQFAVGVIDLSAMVTPSLRPGDGGIITIGKSQFVGASGRPHAGAERIVDLHGYRLGIRAGRLDPPPVSTTTGLILVLGTIAAGVGGVGVLRLSAQLRDQRDAIALGQSQAELIAEVAPVVQQSLDLADVLPSIAVQLQDHFGLSGVHLAAGATSDAAVQVFGLGARPPEPLPPSLSPPDTLAAGEGLVLALQRGGRGVALLELVAGRDLNGEELRSLRVLTELVTAAVVNANLYASQQDAVRRLRDLDALKTVFLSTASHELRTPATAIGGFASLLEQRWDNFPEDRRREMVERIAANARSLGAVVEDLLDFSLLDRREQALTTSPTYLEGLVRGVVARLAPLLSDHVIEVTASQAPPIAGEQNALERVVTNLLTNAAKFSPPSSTVTISVGPAPGGATLVVSDQGPGVPDEDRSRIFTRFYRGAGEAVVQTRGVGIGLSVVLELVERHGGRIDVDGAPGGGARFTVWLPEASPSDAHSGGPPATDQEVQDAPAI
ncbi:MAG TPA: ATP-binding protein [Acidimicrobiales bacterium]|nr:ATP-binding protein [Acidimicrobiales bacterium]